MIFSPFFYTFSINIAIAKSASSVCLTALVHRFIQFMFHFIGDSNSYFLALTIWLCKGWLYCSMFVLEPSPRTSCYYSLLNNKLQLAVLVIRSVHLTVGL